MPSIQGWFRPTDRPTKIYIRSRLFVLDLHFLDSIHSSARCAGRECALCEFYPIRHHHAICVQPERTRELRIFELRVGHAEIVADITLRQPYTIGLPLWTWRDESEDGRPICVSLDAPPDYPKASSRSQIEAKEVQCQAYIAAIGRKQYELAHALLSRGPGVLA